MITSMTPGGHRAGRYLPRRLRRPNKEIQGRHTSMHRNDSMHAGVPLFWRLAPLHHHRRPRRPRRFYRPGTADKRRARRRGESRLFISAIHLGCISAIHLVYPSRLYPAYISSIYLGYISRQVAYPADENAIEAVQQLCGNLFSALLVPIAEHAQELQITTPGIGPFTPTSLNGATCRDIAEI